MSSSQVYVIYARVSTLEQREGGRSIVDQVSKCARHIEENGGILAMTFQDDGYSGSSTNRPALKDLLRYCQENDVDRVLMVDTDRLARNTNDHFALKAIFKKYGTQVESLNQPMINDSPEGNLLDGILASVNAFYPQVTGRKTSDTMLEKALGGWFPGPARLGYINQHDPTQSKGLRNIISPHPVTGPLVTQAFSLYASGQYSLESLCAEMEKRGLRSINNKVVNHTSMRHMLGNIFYTGDFKYKGDILKGKHQPLTTKAIFNRCQMILEQHNHYADRSRKHKFLLNELVACGICGSKYTASRKEEKNIDYYHCNLKKTKHSNEGQNVLVADLDKAVAELFKAVTLPKEIVDKVIEKAREILAETHLDVDEKKRALAANKANHETRRNNLEVKLLDGVIDDETYKRHSAEIGAVLREIEKELIQLNDDRSTNIQEFEQLLRLSTNIYQAYLDAPRELKRRYIALFWEKIVAQDKEIKKAVPTQLFRAILPKELQDMDSPVLTDFNWLPG